MNSRKIVAFVSLCFVPLLSSCSSLDIKLKQDPLDESSKNKLLDVRVERFKCSRINTDVALWSLHKTLESHGYKAPYGFDDEDAYKRAENTFVTISLRNCDVRTVLEAILLKARLEYYVPRHAIMIGSAEFFHASPNIQETWAGTTYKEYRPRLARKKSKGDHY